MKEPEVLDMVEFLGQQGALAPDVASRLAREARGERVSIRLELRLMLWAGVLLLTSGAGLFVVQYHKSLGPLAIGGLLGLCAVACAWYAFRHAPSFTWESTGDRHLAYDYILLLGLLLAGTDLAYLESQMGWLGSQWQHHLLVGAALALAAAYRFDSRTALSLGLSSFASWWGISMFRPIWELGRPHAGTPLLHSLLCGSLFVAAGLVGERTRRKAHFEPVYGFTGYLMALTGTWISTWEFFGSPIHFASLLLLGLGAAGVWLGLRTKRLHYLLPGLAALPLALHQLLGSMMFWERGGTASYLFLSTIDMFLGVGTLVAAIFAWLHVRGNKS